MSGLLTVLVVLVVLRWAAAGTLAAEDQSRRVKGYRELPSSPWHWSAPPPRSPACSTCQPCRCLTV
jgi:hypothetical protein